MTNDRAVPDPAVEPTLSVARVASLLGIALRTTYDGIARGEIPSIRVGRAIRVPTARLLARYPLAPDAESADGEAA